jgi:hypothetical protein
MTPVSLVATLLEFEPLGDLKPGCVDNVPDGKGCSNHVNKQDPYRNGL